MSEPLVGLLGLAVGLVLGLAVGLVLGRRATSVPASAPSPAPAPPAPTAETEVADAAPDPATAGPLPAGGRATDAAVAAAVLEVSDRLTSTELRRRLNDALGLLPGAALVAPNTGEPFDPDLHLWDATVESPTAEPETVASTSVAGLLRADGSVDRRARVAVFVRSEQPDETDADPAHSRSSM